MENAKEMKMYSLQEYANEIKNAPTPFSIPEKAWPSELQILFKDSLYSNGSLKINAYTVSTMIVGATMGIACGIFIDFLVRSVQYKTARRFKKAHAEFLLVQILVNLFFVGIVSAANKNFLPWLELSLSGIFFRLTFFLVQGNLARNTAPFLPKEFRPVYEDEEED